MNLQHHQYTLDSLAKVLIDTAPTIIVLLDETETVMLTNKKYQKLADDLSRHEPITLFLKVIKDQLGQKWETLRARQGHFSDQEVRFDPDRLDHPRWFACSGNWFQETTSSEKHPPVYLLLVANEITQLKRQQEEVRMNALRALLAEEELTEGMRETLAGTIHQLQGPINLISAAVGMLKRRAETNGLEDPLCLTLQETLENSTQVLDKLRHCLPLPDEEEESVMPVNLNKLLRDVLSISTQRLLAEGIVVEWQPALDLPAVLGHVGRLRSMFKHLLANAIEAMTNNRTERELRIRTRSDAEMITVVIEDTGPGIPESLRLKVFEPFFTTKKSARRTGMGLAAVQEIVNLHTGTIRIDPEYRQGSRFVVQFPTAHFRKI
jgi:nitrogen fixation negative regulator NifL